MSWKYYVPLVRDAIRLVDTFPGSKQCLDDFLEDISADVQSLDPRQQSFLLDTVSGCIEHKQLLDVVVELFYRRSEGVHKNDYSMYLIVCYLTTCCLDQVGLKCFRSIVKSLGFHKVQTFLLFFFSNLTKVVQKKWTAIYDAEHVQKQWIEPTLRWCPEIMALLEQLAVKASSRASLQGKNPPKTTKPQEFDLTRPKPRALVVPEIIPELEKHRPVPRTTYMPPKDMKIIDEVKQKNKQKAEMLLYKANHAKSREATCPHKSKLYQKVVSEIEESFNSTLKFNFQSKQVPPTTKQSSWNIKLNNAAIMRQEALVDRQLQQERQRIECLVEGAREPSAFLHWQHQMREKDQQEELAKLECRRFENLIDHEESAMTRHRVKLQNQAAVQRQKEENAELMHRYAVKRLQEEKEMRELIQQVSDGHKNAKAAKEKLHVMKQKIVREVSKESQEHLRRALAEAEAEMARKCELIRQIRAMASNSRSRSCSFDDREAAGNHLLGAMSLCELRERLASLKEAERVERQRRQTSIQMEKDRKKKLLQQKLDTIHLHKDSLKQIRSSRKEETKTQPAVIANEAVLALQRRLEEKKQERISIRLRESHSSKPSHSEEPLETQRDWGELEQAMANQVQKLSVVSLK